MNDKIEELLNSLGALSEVCMVLFQNLLKVGFREDQALPLVQTFISTITHNENNTGV